MELLKQNKSDSIESLIEHLPHGRELAPKLPKIDSDISSLSDEHELDEKKAVNQDSKVRNTLKDNSSNANYCNLLRMFKTS